ncbi:diguanylate cyclase [Pseudomonas sp. NPDC078700]|uniref:diguanylate cyclase n=1 Tax=Pseudomonas sp. NPDC078700 TaxID=3364424 RepID=UPI0037C5F664
MVSNPKAGLSFAKRTSLPRAIGLGVGFFAVASVLWGREHSVAVWALLVGYCFVWPWLAYFLSCMAASPFVNERRHVLVDSFMGGFWIATIEFNLLPTVMMLSMLAMNNTATGGARFVALGLLFQLLGMAVSMSVFGFQLSPETSQQVVYGCIPMLVIHPMTIGMVLYQLAMQLGQHKKTLRTLSRTDSLTQLFNRGYWVECLQLVFEECRTGQQPACLALIDIDNFKNTNDKHGHIVGDDILLRVAERIRQLVRADDLAGRYGGDEFCVLLPNTGPDQAVDVMERLRQDISTQQFPAVPGLRISLSIGIAHFDERLGDATTWLSTADQALYAAKHQGRNRTVLHLACL